MHHQNVDPGVEDFIEIEKLVPGEESEREIAAVPGLTSA
jgi:hypothetical protein